MPKCVYCGKVYGEHEGLTLVGVDGSVKHLCSGKCRKNMKMKRRNVQWIKKSQKSKADLAAEIKAEVAEEHETASVPESKE